MRLTLNAVLESFHASLKKDLIHRRSWPTEAEARTAVFDYVEAFYNRRRRHSTLGMLSPVDFENSTLSDPGASLAASRLASTNKSLSTTTSGQGRLTTPCPPKRAGPLTITRRAGYPGYPSARPYWRS